MTNRLYYDESYLREFDGIVTGCREGKTGYEIALDQSAFYPTSGGQPFDTGVLFCGDQVIPVLDVNVDKQEEVWHTLAVSLPLGSRVHGKIDWARRFDHMQQHGGEHMLAGAVYRMMQGTTIGLHLGKENSSIDVTLPDGRVHFTGEEISALENQVNEWIQEDAQVRCWFPDTDELAALPLRKAPTVSEHIRIVAFGDYEMVACGGTHPSSAGQIGLVKILSVTPAKGKARVTFVCGMRALKYLALCQKAAEESGRMLSCPVAELPSAVEKMKAQNAEAARFLQRARTDEYHQKMQSAEADGVCCIWLEGADLGALSEAAGEYIRKPGRILLCGGNGRLIFACSADQNLDMAALLRTVARGGGKKDFASGAGDEAAMEKAKFIITQK